MGIKCSIHLRTLSLTLSMVLAMGSRLSALGYSQPIRVGQRVDRSSQVLVAGLTFKVPNIRASGNREPGASRGNSCRADADEKPITALSPDTNIGWTVGANPTFFFNNSQTDTQLAEFVLLDKEGEVVYETMVELPDKPGVVSLDLSEGERSSPSLKQGERYQWYFALICNPNDRSRDVAIDGWIERVERNSSLAAKLQTAQPSERPAVYAEAGVWFDAINSLAQLRQANPNDPRLVEDWETLLESVDLGKIAKAPLVGSVTKVEEPTP